jgi:3-oxoacyl-[acyl-carrier-protein] synthase-1
MTDVFIVSDNIISPVGATSADNFAQLERSVSGVKRHDNPGIFPEPFYAALFPDDHFTVDGIHTKFEQLLIASIRGALENADIDPGDKKTILIVSSTKGNISLLETGEYNETLEKRISLNTSANLVANHLNFINKPLVVCHACISGLLAMITALRLIKSGIYENAVIAGADVITKFVLSGFQSFQALSPGVCKPFDAERDGLNLGEGAATIIVSSNKKYADKIKLVSGSVNNDANHISGPSRTGEELYRVINSALAGAGLSAPDISFISAHGTATNYNDEMEAKAIALAGLQHTPANSLKAYFGHTLGAAGLLESVITIHSMQRNTVISSLGFTNTGVTKPINISKTLMHVSLENCLKTASGFGGCNAAVVFSKKVK